MAIFNDNPQSSVRLRSSKKPKFHLGYGTANKARRSVKLLKKQPHQYQVQAGHTLYYRAKFHKYQTKGMKNAKKIYGKFLKSLKRKTLKNKKGGKFLAKGTQGYVFIPPLRCKPVIRNKESLNEYDSQEYVCKLTTKEIAVSEMKIGELMEAKLGNNIDNFIVYPLTICEVDDIEKQRPEDQNILKQIPSKLGYDTLIIMKNGGLSLKTIIEDIRDSINSNRNEYIKYDKDYIKSLFNSMYNLGEFILNMNNVGYFHNDIKDDNIVYNDKYARLIDLGLSGETRKQLKYPKKVVNDLCYFMMVLTELFDTIQKKFNLREPISLKFKYDIENCYSTHTEFTEDINTMKKYIITYLV
jgi:serine/threonine protein kinase